MSKAYVYLPDDEPDEATFNSHVFTLEPNAATEIVSPFKEFSAKTIADHIAQKLGMWGAVVVSGPAKNGKASVKADQEAVDAAEHKYLEATKEWAEALVLAYEAKSRPRRDAGLDLPAEDEDTKKARAWLAKHVTKLRTKGLSKLSKKKAS